MLVSSVQVTRSPLDEHRFRLSCEVVYDTPAIGPETYWLEIPRTYACELTTSGNPRLALLLPLAVRLREPLAVPWQVDCELFESVHELMRVWSCWYPQLRLVPVEANVSGEVSTCVPSLTASLFSGGVDA